MSDKKCLLLSPVFSRYQILSSKIIETYVKKALKNVDHNNKWIIQNIIEHTPYGMYKNNVLQPYGSIPLANIANAPTWLNNTICTQWGDFDLLGGMAVIKPSDIPGSALWCVPGFLKNSQGQVLSTCYSCSLHNRIRMLSLLFSL